MKFKGWIPLGSLILLMCAQQGDATLILGSMLMAATAAMTGGLIMGPLTIGGLIMMMMMAANQQGTQRQQASTNIASTLESSQNLLNLLSSLTGAASNLATSASTQSVTTQPKASKRELYSPQNLEELLAASSRSTSTRTWSPTHPTHPTAEPRVSSSNYFDVNHDIWNTKPTFHPDTGFAVEPIPDDLLDLAMRYPHQSRSFQAFPTPSTTTTTTSTTSGPRFEPSDVISRMMDLASPSALSSSEDSNTDMRWVKSEPGDLFSSFPEIKEEDLLSLVRKRATREVLSTKFRLEDIANVTYANDKDPIVKQELSAREQQEIVNTRILRQLSALDPLRCLPQLACNLQATPPSKQSGILNDYAYLMKTVFERDDQQDDEEEDDEKKPASTSSTSTATKTSKRKGSASSASKSKGVAGGTVADDIATLLEAVSSSGKKKLKYHSPGKTNKGKSAGPGKTRGDGKTRDDDDDDDDKNDEFSSEEVPMSDDELDKLLLKEQYEMERIANEELLNDDPDLLPYVLKSASKAPPHLGPDNRYDENANAAGLSQNPGMADDMMPPAFLRDIAGLSDARGNANPYEHESYIRPSPLFSPTKLQRYKTEELNEMSSSELNKLLRQVSHPGQEYVFEEDGGHGHDGGIGTMLSSYMPRLPEISIGFTRRRTTGNSAFDDDPFFDDFDFRKRSLDQFANQGLRKVRRVVRKAKEGGPGSRIAYLRSMKKMLDTETDPAKVFKMAGEAGAKVKSARQCRFLFNRCPLNSQQLLGMIGNIRTAVLNLSNGQQMLAGTPGAAKPSVAQDLASNTATIGPNVVKSTPTPPVADAAPAASSPSVQIHHLNHMIQPVMPQHSHSQSSQNTLVVPQIIQVPMPIHTQQAAAPAPQVYIQSPHQLPQQVHMHMVTPPTPQQSPSLSPSIQMHPIFNFGSSSNSGSAEPDSSSGPVSISHELPSANPKPTSSTPFASKPAAPFSTKTKPAGIPASSKPTRTNAPIVDLADLFDDDRADNVLFPKKTVIETEIRDPEGTLNSLQAAILAIEKINNAAERQKIKQEDDEREDFKLNEMYSAALQKPIRVAPSPPKSVPSGLRLPYKVTKNNNKHRPQDDHHDEEDTSEEEEDEEEDDEFRRLPDPLDPQRRNFLHVPTKTTQFGSTLTVPSTQTFVKKTLQVEPSPPPRRLDYNPSSSEEEYANIISRRRYAPNPNQSGSSSEEQQIHSNRRQRRRPKILYPQEEVEKPVFIPL